MQLTLGLFAACLSMSQAAPTSGTAIGGGVCSPNIGQIVFAEIADVSGDGVDEIAQTLWYSDTSSTVQVYDGKSKALLLTWHSPAGETAFGSGVADTADFDGDGLGDIAISSVSGQVGLIRVYSSANGKTLAILRQSPGVPADTSDVQQMGDLDLSGSVTSADLATAASLALAGDVHELADWDVDGVTTVPEVTGVAALLGTSLPASAAQSLVDAVNAADTSFDADDVLSATYVNGTLVVKRKRGGFFKCLICAIKCAADLRHAADCIGIRKTIAEECFALHPNVCSLEYTECVEQRERTALEDCIKRVAEAAGECGECVYRCGPRLR